MSRRRAGVARAAAALTALVLVLVTACTDEPTQPGNIPTGASSSTSSGVPSTSEAPQTDEEQIIAVWKKWFETLYSLKTPTDDEVRAAFSPISDLGMVDDVVKLFQSYRTDGYAPGGYVVFGPIDVAIDGANASVTECRDTSTELLVNAADGSVVVGGESSSKITGGFVRDSAGNWLLSTYSSVVTECA